MGVFVRALEADFHVFGQSGIRDPCLGVFDLGGATALFYGVGAQANQAEPISAADARDARGRYAVHEIGERDLTLIGGDAQFVDGAYAARILWQSDADIHLVLCIVRPILADQNAIGDKLDSGANLGDVNAELARLGAVDFELLLNAGQW